MPGPQAKNRKSRKDTGTTDKRAAKRLAARHAAFVASLSGFRKPGSENRKK